MSTWLRRALLTALVFLAVWLLVIVYWQINSRMPTISEAVLYLLVLPLTLLGGVWLIRKSIQTSAAASAAALASAAARPANEHAQTARLQERTDAQERALSLTILAHAVHSPQGVSAREVLEALKSQKVLIELDTELVSEDGFPLFVARAAELDSTGLTPALEAVCAGIGLAKLRWENDQLRALAMAQTVLADTCAALTTHALLERYLTATTETQRAAIALPGLQLLVLLPSRWSEDHRKAALIFLSKQVEHSGWPADKLLFNPISLPAATDAMSMIDQRMLRSHRKNQAFLSVVLACESYVSESAVTALDADDRLLTSQRKNGVIPGEGAACVLLADAKQAQAYQGEGWATLHRVAQGRREKSVDALGRIGASVITDLCKEALAVAALGNDKVTYLLADCDQRANRVAELLEFGNHAFPDLDLGVQCLRVSASSGLCGDVSTVTALALAHDLCANEAVTSLCVSNQDAWLRSVVVVKPHVPNLATLSAAA